MAKLKAVGQRGSWFAEINGDSFPCVHDYWTRKSNGSMVYSDPNCSPSEPKWAELITALHEKKRAILTTDDTPDEGASFTRTGYIALFEIDQIVANDSDLGFRFVARLADLV